MKFSPKTTYKNLKPHITTAIKESCYKSDARLYNIANEVQHIQTFSVEPGVEIAEGLTKIIDQTIKESVALDCDISVIVKGILLGAFRSSPSILQEALLVAKEDTLAAAKALDPKFAEDIQAALPNLDGQKS